MTISGVIEGFYGPPWTHDDRLAWIDRLCTWGMTHYVWAAKQEPRHRDDWAAPFTDDELVGFGELARRRPEVTLAVGLSPGVDASVDAVETKLRPAVDAGTGVVVVSADDLPALDAATTHRTLANELLARLQVPVWIVPTHYCGAEPSPYLDALCRDLDPSVHVMWTGDRVVNDAIGAAAAARRAAVTGRPPLLWDNTPVNDAVMRDALHLGPLGGRDPALRDVCAGVLWNPMEFARASIATLTSAAGWWRGEDPDDVWTAEVRRRGWWHLAVATSFVGDPHWPGAMADDPTWWHEMLAGLPGEASEVGLDPAVQPWIDAAREGATIGRDAAVLTGASASPVRVLGLAARWRSWRRRDVLTFGAGPRIRPDATQDGHGRFVVGPGAIVEAESLVDRAVRRVLPS
ncbi:MAG: beta-N-acetylglucosaminidase domain-containing protein [Ilumatobacteraceae bacterium]